MNYKQLIEDAFQRAKQSIIQINQTASMADVSDQFDRILSEYDEATQIILNRIKEESPESYKDVERLRIKKREDIIAV